MTERTTDKIKLVYYQTIEAKLLGQYIALTARLVLCLYTIFKIDVWVKKTLAKSFLFFS